MINDKLKEAWRVAARERLDNSEEIQEIHKQSAPVSKQRRHQKPKNIGALDGKNDQITSDKFARGQFARTITNLVKAYDLSDEEVLKTDLTQKSKNKFVQKLHDDSKAGSEHYPNNIISKALLLGLRKVQRDFK